MEAYLRSKARLFRDHLAPGAIAVVNIDDAVAEQDHRRRARTPAPRCCACGREADTPRPSSDLLERRSDSRERAPGSGCLRASFDVELPLLGDFNLENLLVAVGIGRALGIPPEMLAAGVARLPAGPGPDGARAPASGRADPTVLVDYAHTPDAVDKLLRAVRPLCKGA